MKLVKRLIAAIAVIAASLAIFYAVWLSPRYTVPILMYHRFGYGQGSLFVSPQNFERQMVFLKKRGYNVISLEKLADGIKNKKRFPHNSVVITMDDGYEDNYARGYPVLRRYNFPATFFISPALIGRKDYLTWGQARELSANNVSIGGHTRNHVYLPSISDDHLLWNEIAGTKAAIEKKTGVKADFYCYPTGGFNEKIKEMVKLAGYKGACTTNRGLADYNSDLYELKRIKVTNSDLSKPFCFRAKLSGYYNLFRGKKKGS
ncbi:MAG: polysaccharide deacetylase family protein [Candidatus Omnitrophica bacterium]|nr:polysaccharide deacetylase family protein [Candidatus Omnitrophota bacterium]